MSRFDPRLYLDRWALARLVLVCATAAGTILVGATALAAGFPGVPSVGFQRAFARDLGIIRVVSPHVVVGDARAVGFERPVPPAVPTTISQAVSTGATPPTRAQAAPAPVVAPVTRTVPVASPIPVAPVEPPVEAPPAEVQVPPVEVLPVPEPEPAPPPAPEPEPEPEPAPPPAPEPEPEPALPPAPEPEPEPALLEANFESGLSGWSTAGVGEVTPKVTTGIVREGDKASTVTLTGTEDRSELILGGNGTASTAGTIQFHEGDEYWYGFSFYIESMIWGKPGAHNIIMQFKSEGEGSPNFALDLWNYAGDDGTSGGKGLWSEGDAMGGGNRFLSPVSEQAWHDVQIHFKASSVGAGFYEVFFDGNLVDSRSNVSMIVPGRQYAYIKDGLYRNGEAIPGTSEIKLDAAKLGDTRESVLP